MPEYYARVLSRQSPVHYQYNQTPNPFLRHRKINYSTLSLHLQTPLTLASNRAIASGPLFGLGSNLNVAKTGEVAGSELLGRNGMGVLGRLEINCSCLSFSTHLSLECNGKNIKARKRKLTDDAADNRAIKLAWAASS